MNIDDTSRNYIQEHFDYEVGIQLPGDHKVVSPNEKLIVRPPAEFMDINWLRKQRECSIARFKGKEYSFVKNTKKATVTDLVLNLIGDRLEYQVEKQSASFTRLR